MSRIAVLLIAMLAAGCTTSPKLDNSGGMTSLTDAQWQLRQPVLSHAPEQLKQALTQAGSGGGNRVTHAQEQHAGKPDPRDVLLAVLAQARDPLLRQDDEFENVTRALSGKNGAGPQTFATALVDFLLQPDFACHQPVYARYFSVRYGTKKDSAPCLGAVPISVQTPYDWPQIVWLDPKRVRSIHLLFAGKSPSLVSRFGHVALRLVVCPSDDSSDEECDANLFEHLVLGFQAYVDELSLDTFKALRSEYKAYLFANRFMDVYQQYAIDEFRELYSLPLKMGDAQRELAVRQLADIHWRYADNYSFFTRNCATMMEGALRILLPNLSSPGNIDSDYVRPDSLFEAMKSSPLADGERLTSLAKAEQEGYFFSSTRQFYDQAVSEVKRAMYHPLFNSLESYLEVDPMQRRSYLKSDQDYSNRLRSEQHLREAQIMLEEYAMLHSQRQLAMEAAKYIEQQDFLKKANIIRAQLDETHFKIFEDCLLAPLKQRSNPGIRDRGIPTESEIPPISRQENSCQSDQARRQLREAIARIKDAHSSQWQRLNLVARYWAESLANVNYLKQL